MNVLYRSLTHNHVADPPAPRVVRLQIEKGRVFDGCPSPVLHLIFTAKFDGLNSDDSNDMAKELEQPCGCTRRNQSHIC